MDEFLFVRWIFLLVLVAASGFFSGTEMALFSLTRTQVENLRQTRGAAGVKVAALLSSPQRLLVSIYIGNELVNVAISAVATLIALELFGDVGVAVAVGVGALVLLVFGEVSPKTLAHYHNEKWALLAAYPISVFVTLIHPVQVVVTSISSKLAALFGGGEDARDAMFTEDEIKTLVEKGAGEGVIGEEEKEMIHGVFELGDVTVGDVMTPRTDMLAIAAETSVKNAWDKMMESTFARAPVYQDNVDNIVGVLCKKDFLKFEYPPPSTASLSDLLREPFLVPETMTINELLRGFKKRKVHMAVALDEYGGVQGVVTMEDVISELVGDSRGADGENGLPITRIAPATYRLSASITLEEFNEHFDVNLEHEDIETVGGYVFHLFGYVPEWGESVKFSGLSFTVEGVSGTRITELKLKVDAEVARGQNG
ncbi:Magnesium and cobalt efflux protein CorC [hydrothermal vent metagenome]|uniref:Magnesium and cobalt efflux protein CorC n=1 Tax=hydrothermal vent metagenome TaxID=652676 RepID=A0A3B1C895_9ZZZZ